MELRQQGPVLVIGPGAIGAFVAARLGAAGTEVIVAARTKNAAGLLRSSGVVARTHTGVQVQARPRVVCGPDEVQAPIRFAVLATKCSAAKTALATWQAALGEAPVVAMQNGVLGDDLKPLLGDRLMECTVAFPATLVAPGTSEQTGPGGFHLGPWPQAGPRDDPAAYRAVAAVLAAAGPVSASANMQGVKWSKLLINSCMTSLGVATGTDFGPLMQERQARAAFFAIVREGHAAGRADGVRFEPVSGFRAGLMARAWPGKHAVLRLMGRKYRRHRSSSLQSLQRGQKTEVDFLNGHILATAAKHGLAAPVNRALVDLVHDIEEGRRRPGMENLAFLA